MHGMPMFERTWLTNVTLDAVFGECSAILSWERNDMGKKWRAIPTSLFKCIMKEIDVEGKEDRTRKLFVLYLYENRPVILQSMPWEIDLHPFLPKSGGN